MASKWWTWIPRKARSLSESQKPDPVTPGRIKYATDALFTWLGRHADITDEGFVLPTEAVEVLGEHLATAVVWDKPFVVPTGVSIHDCGTYYQVEVA